MIVIAKNERTNDGSGSLMDLESLGVRSVVQEHVLRAECGTLNTRKARL